MNFAHVSAGARLRARACGVLPGVLLHPRDEDVAAQVDLLFEVFIPQLDAPALRDELRVFEGSLAGGLPGASWL